MRKGDRWELIRKILAVSLPVTIGAVALPLFSFLECLLAVRCPGRCGLSAAAQYGLFSGAAASLLTLPTVFAAGVSASAVPYLATGERGERATEAFRLSALISLPFCVYFLFFADSLSAFLYGGLGVDARNVLNGLLRLGCFNAFLSALMQTAVSVTVAYRCTGKGAVFLFIGLILRFALLLPLLSVIGVYALPLAETGGTFLTVFLYARYLKKVHGGQLLTGAVVKPFFVSLIGTAAAYLLIGRLAIPSFFRLALSSLVAFGCYFAIILLPIIKKMRLGTK